MIAVVEYTSDYYYILPFTNLTEELKTWPSKKSRTVHLAAFQLTLLHGIILPNHMNNECIVSGDIQVTTQDPSFSNIISLSLISELKHSTIFQP